MVLMQIDWFNYKKTFWFSPITLYWGGHENDLTMGHQYHDSEIHMM